MNSEIDYVQIARNANATLTQASLMFNEYIDGLNTIKSKANELEGSLRETLDSDIQKQELKISEILNEIKRLKSWAMQRAIIKDELQKRKNQEEQW